MTKAEGEELLRRVSRQEIRLAFTDHFWIRARERFPGFMRQHAYDAIRRGWIRGAPERDAKFESYKVKVRAKIPDFGRVELVIAISWLDDAVCITIYETR